MTRGRPQRSTSSRRCRCARRSRSSRRSSSPGAKTAIAETHRARDRQPRCEFLNNVGLDYLVARRARPTRSRAARRSASASRPRSAPGLTGVMYVLDEPSIGLHQRDNARLIETLKRLRDLGNTVIVVEHDEEAIRAADHVVDMGPGAGVHGGEIVAAGHARARSCAIPDRSPGKYLSRTRVASPCRALRNRADARSSCASRGARGNNLKNVDARAAGGPLRLRHRRLRLGQVDAHQRHALRTRSRATSTARRPSPRRTTRSRASSTSTR